MQLLTPTKGEMVFNSRLWSQLGLPMELSILGVGLAYIYILIKCAYHVDDTIMLRPGSKYRSSAAACTAAVTRTQLGRRDA